MKELIPTHKNQLEAQEHAMLMGAISDAILAVDLDGAPLFFNSKFALLKNTARNSGATLFDLFEQVEIVESYKSALNRGESRQLRAIAFVQEGGTKRFYSVSISPMRKKNGTIYGAVGIFHDVTELKSAEQIRIDFVANVSHELRTPLTAIKGYADTLIRDIHTGQHIRSDFIEIIARNSDRLMSLINDLLDLSSLESTDVLHKTQISTHEITRRITDHLRNTFEQKKQSIVCKIEAPSVRADQRRLEQVLINLLTNANKYSPVGGEIKIIWESFEDVLLKVSDNGPGIPPEHHHRLFERFYRVDKARSREEGGTGLGLAIVKHIMQKHDGAVWIESQPGNGSTFVCRFPS